MSYHGGKEASTPIGRSVVLPTPGNTNSISPISTTSGASSSRKIGQRRTKKRQKSPLSRRRKIVRISYESDIIREAPPPIADIRSIIDEPLHPRPRIVSPKNPTERIYGDVEYVQAPELETISKSHEHHEEITDSEESEESEEYNIQRPLKTYKGPGPRKTYKGSFSASVTNSGLADSHFYHDSETERLWAEVCKEDAEKFAEQQRAAPPRKTIRNREIMLRIRKEVAERTAAAKLDKRKKGARGKKRKEPERSSSPRLITMRGDLSGYTVIIDSDDPFDQ